MREKILLVLLGGVLTFGAMYLFYIPAHAGSPMQMVDAGKYVFQPATISAYVANSDGFMTVNTIVRGDYNTGDMWVLQASTTSLINPNFSEVNWKKVAPMAPAVPAPDSIQSINNSGF